MIEGVKVVSKQAEKLKQEKVQDKKVDTVSAFGRGSDGNLTKLT